MGVLTEKLMGARDHVGATGHREWVLEEYAVVTPEDFEHRFGCQGCSFEVWVSGEDIAQEGRLDLLDRYGLGAVLESIRQTRPTERFTDWWRLMRGTNPRPPIENESLKSDR